MGGKWERYVCLCSSCTVCMRGDLVVEDALNYITSLSWSALINLRLINQPQVVPLTVSSALQVENSTIWHSRCCSIAPFERCIGQNVDALVAVSLSVGGRNPRDSFTAQCRPHAARPTFGILASTQAYGIAFYYKTSSSLWRPPYARAPWVDGLLIRGAAGCPLASSASSTGDLTQQYVAWFEPTLHPSCVNICEC